MIVIAIALAVFGLIAVLALRHPLLARLAAREAVRRRGQSLLVIGGLMIGAAAITASLVGADSNQDSFTLDAYRSWGNIDLTVTRASSFFPPGLVTTLSADPGVRRTTDGMMGAIDMVGSVSDLTRRQGEPAITLVGFDPTRQVPFGRFTLLDGRTTLGGDLGTSGVLITRGLADKLDAQVGDVLLVQTEQGSQSQGHPVDLRLVGVVKGDGPGAFGLGPTVFAPLPLAQAIVGTDQINQVWISANGDLKSGLQGGEVAAPAVGRALRAAGAPASLKVRQVKRDTVHQASENTKFLRAFLLAMSLLIVAAGAALVVNLIMMLAEERRPRLGVLRALGLTRRRLVQMSVIEGAMYSLAAALVGTVIGIGAGRIIAARFASAFNQFFGGQADFHFVFSVKPRTLAISFASGALVTLVTVWLAARRTSRMSIPAAIRDLPEPARERRRPWVRRVVIGLTAGVGLLMMAASIPSGSKGAFPRLLGGALLILALSMVLKPRLTSRIHSSLVGGVLAVWAFYMTSSLSDPGQDANTFFAVFTVSVLLAVFGLSILFSANLQLAERFVTLLGRTSSSIRRNLRAPLAYLARRPLRTGLTTGMFAVIMAIIALFSVFLSTFRPQYERDSAGYDIRVTSTGTASFSLPASVGPSIQRTAVLPTLGYVGPVETKQFSSVNTFLPLFQLDPANGSGQPLRLSDRAKAFKSDAAVWQALFQNPSYVLSDFANAGETLTLTTVTGKAKFKVIGVQQAGILDGIAAAPQTLARFQGLPRGSTVMVDVKHGVDATVAARRIEANLFSKGVDAQTTKKLLDDSYRASKTFFSVIDILMRMGLVVGILSLGILGLRAVVERRHVIGVLRAIGYRKRGVLAGLMAEAGVTATLGVGVGVVTGLTMGWLFVRQQASSNFGIDGASLGGVIGLVYLAVVAVTLGPAWRASRLPPAEAVRYTE